MHHTYYLPFQRQLMHTYNYDSKDKGEKESGDSVTKLHMDTQIKLSKVLHPD